MFAPCGGKTYTEDFPCLERSRDYRPKSPPRRLAQPDSLPELVEEGEQSPDADVSAPPSTPAREIKDEPNDIPLPPNRASSVVEEEPDTVPDLPHQQYYPELPPNEVAHIAAENEPAPARLNPAATLFVPPQVFSLELGNTVAARQAFESIHNCSYATPQHKSDPSSGDVTPTLNYTWAPSPPQRISNPLHYNRAPNPPQPISNPIYQPSGRGSNIEAESSNGTN